MRTKSSGFDAFVRVEPLTGRHRRHSLGLYLQGGISVTLANDCRAAEVDFNRKELNKIQASGLSFPTV